MWMYLSEVTIPLSTPLSKPELPKRIMELLPHPPNSMFFMNIC